MTIEDMQWSKEVGQTSELTLTVQMHLQGCGEAVHACIMAGRNFESSITQPQLMDIGWTEKRGYSMSTLEMDIYYITTIGPRIVKVTKNHYAMLLVKIASNSQCQ